jgi:hypothetical protein
MKGIHVHYTLPNKKTIPDDWFFLMSTISALYWKKYNGEIWLYTDPEYLKVLDIMGISKFWDNIKIIDPSDLSEIDLSNFWAAPKIYVMDKQTEPFVSVDTDLYLVTNIPSEFYDADYSYSHRELLNNYIYPPITEMCIPPGYKIEKNLGFNEPAANCSLLYFRNIEFLKKYTQASLKYMKGNFANPKERQFKYCHMVFAEQRLLNALAKFEKVKSRVLIREYFDPGYPHKRPSGWVDKKGDGIFSVSSLDPFLFHLWGNKASFEKDPTYKMILTRRLENIFNELSTLPFSYYKNKLSSYLEQSHS